MRLLIKWRSFHGVFKVSVKKMAWLKQLDSSLSISKRDEKPRAHNQIVNYTRPSFNQEWL